MSEKEFSKYFYIQNNFLKSNFIIISLFVITITSFIIRIIYLPFDLPFSNDSDALFYFWYSIDINSIGHLPDSWTPLNNGWPIFNSFLFSISQIENISELMDLQRLVSVIFSVLTLIPIFIICKKFVPEKFALIGVVIFAFEPRLMINSLLGVTDPLYIFLGTTSLALFLQQNKKFVYISFILASFATLIRGEGLYFFITISIMFFIRFRHEKKFLLSRYFIIFSIFLLIIIPMSLYRLDVDGNDGIFLRTTSSLANISSETSNASGRNVIEFLGETFELFVKYLGWISLPIFIFLTPIGIFLIFKNRTFEKYTIILSLGIISLPALVAYSVPAHDTRYLYFLYPMFCVLSVLTIHQVLRLKQNQNLLIIVLVIGIFVGSVVFFDYLKPNFEQEYESYKIADYIVKSSTGINKYSGSNYILTSQIPKTLPFLSSDVVSKISILDPNNFTSLDEFLSVSDTKKISHLVIDENTSETSFLYDIFENESDYTFLKKEFDSREMGYKYHVKIFRIVYDEYVKN